jgi:glycosyltransferase involved in cell wall biosynthesis
MKKNLFINFCPRLHQDHGGTYTAASMFRRAVESYFIDLQMPGYDSPSEADYTVSGSINPFTALVKSGFPSFFSFIPEKVKEKTSGVIAHGAFLAHFSYAYQLSRHLRVPLYLVPHGTTDPYVFSYGKLKKRIWLEMIGKPATHQAKKIIFSTALERDKSILPFARNKGNICPFSVEPPQDIERISCRRWLRQQLGLSDEEKILLYFGKYDQFKHPLETLRSFVKVKPKNWNFLIMGYGNDKSLKEKIASYSSLSNVFIHPPVFGQDKWKFLAGSDLFVLFSHRENFGFAVAEAASVGLPVYISTGVDIYPFFEHERERLVFDISTEQDIEKALSTLDKISDDNLEYLGQFCREIALKNFSLQQFSQSLKNILIPYAT